MFHLAVLQRNKTDGHLLPNRLLDNLTSGWPINGKRHHHGWKQHAIPQRDDRQCSGGNVQPRFLFSGLSCFILHDWFLISMMRRPSWSVVLPTATRLSPRASLMRRSKRPSGISQIFSSPSSQHFGNGRLPVITSSLPSMRTSIRSALTPGRAEITHKLSSVSTTLTGGSQLGVLP